MDKHQARYLSLFSIEKNFAISRRCLAIGINNRHQQALTAATARFNIPGSDASLGTISILAVAT
jgi:hypothetical protein